MAAGRPKKIIDLEAVRKLSMLGLSKEMIADYIGICYQTMYTHKGFLEVYKKNYTQLGAKVRTTLIQKIDTDTTANIYLDKVMNKTTEKNHDDNIALKRELLELKKKIYELEREKVEKGLVSEPINIVITKAGDK
ncbi:MAG: hypothetical protein ACRC0F_04780 [Cetobacterium sp.]